MAEILSSIIAEEPGHVYQASYTHPSQEGALTRTPISNGWGPRYQQRQYKGSDDIVKFELLQKQNQSLHAQNQCLLAAFNQSRKNSDGLFQMYQSLELKFYAERQIRVGQEVRCQILQNAVDAYDGKSEGQATAGYFDHYSKTDGHASYTTSY